MKYLSDYMNEKQTAVFDKYGVFFAFSNSQFYEKQLKGVKYVSLSSGMMCPKDNVETVMKELDDIYKSCINEDIAENGIEAIIKRELSNHECYYTGDISDAVEALLDYGVSKEDVNNSFRNIAA